MKKIFKKYALIIACCRLYLIGRVMTKTHVELAAVYVALTPNKTRHHFLPTDCSLWNNISLEKLISSATRILPLPTRSSAHRPELWVPIPCQPVDACYALAADRWLTPINRQPVEPTLSPDNLSNRSLLPRLYIHPPSLTHSLHPPPPQTTAGDPSTRRIQMPYHS